MRSIPRRIRVLRTKRTLGTTNAINRRRLRSLPRLFFMTKRLIRTTRQIMNSLFRITIRVIMNVRRMSMFTRVGTSTTRLQKPIILLMIRRFHRRITGTTERNIRIFTTLNLMLHRPIRANTSNTTLPKPTFNNYHDKNNRRHLRPRPRRTTIVIPLILHIMMIRHGTRINTMVNKPTKAPIRLPSKISKTIIYTNIRHNLTVMRTKRRRVRGNRIVTRNRPPTRTIRHASTTTRPAMN